MPSPATAKLLLPNSPDEFEETCLDAFKLRWSDAHAVRHGRNGQAQYGVDIYSPTTRHAAQCKNKTSLTLAEVRAALDRSKAFHLPLASMTFMVGGPRDAPTQAMIDALSLQVQQNCGFPVFVLFWDDIVQLVARDPALVYKHWPTLGGPACDRRAESLEEWRARVFGQEDGVFGPYREPDWWVERRHSEHGVIRAYDFMRVRVYSPQLTRGDFEPEEEEQFAEVIGRAWATGPSDPITWPTVVATHGNEAIVEQGGSDAVFHRRWGWDCRGCLGFVTTLKDAYEPASFPVPDLTWDVEELLRLVGGMLQEQEVMVVLELAVSDLMPSWCPSDRRVDTRICGLRGEAVPPPEWDRKFRRAFALNTRAMSEEPEDCAASLMTTALKDLFRVRLSKKEFVESLRGLREEVRRAQTR